VWHPLGSGPSLSRRIGTSQNLKLTNADVDGVMADVSLKPELRGAADATVATVRSIFWLTMRGLVVAAAMADGPMRVGTGPSAST
jgi:hypothetical protein